MPGQRASDGAEIPVAICTEDVTAARRCAGIGNGSVERGEPRTRMAGYSTQPWTTHATVSIAYCRS